MSEISFQTIFTIASFVLAVIAIISSFVFYILSKKTADKTKIVLNKINLETEVLHNISTNYLDKIVEYAIRGKDKHYLEFAQLLLTKDGESKIQISEKTDRNVLKQQLIFSLKNKPDTLYHLYHKIENNIVYNVKETHNTIEYHLKGSPGGIGSGGVDIKYFIANFIDLHNKNIIILKSINPFEFELNTNMIEVISELYKETYQDNA
ncbi:hypothetical protein MUP95_01485 [bacterium]|nr:hypothetical protein [bacterium]